MEKKLKGTGVALVTPFHKQGAVDFGSMEKLINYTIDNQCDYLVLLGTTGESPTISKDERRALMSFAREVVNKRVPLVLGLGGNNTQDIIDTLQMEDFDGFDAILSVTPYYNKPTQRGLYLHYKSISSASPLPIILYNVPGRTGINMTAETTLSLAHEFKNIVAVKEASGNLTQIAKIIQDRPKNFLVISGDDAITYPLITLGADGVISVVANAYPASFSRMVRLALDGKYNEARKLHYALLPMMEALFMDGSPGGVKAVLDKMKIVPNNLRLPVVKVNKSVNNLLGNLTEEMAREGMTS